MSHFVFVETTRPGIQALEQAKRLGHAVTRLTSHKFDWLLRPEDHAALKQLGCDTVEIDDSQNASSVEAGLRRCLQEGPVDAVLSVLHQCAAPASLAAGLLGLRASSAQGVLNARDKGRCRDLLREHGVPSVRHRVVSSDHEARAFAGSILTVREDRVVRGDLAPDWFERFLPRLHSGHADIRPGQALRRMDGNYEVYGVVREVAPSYEQVVAECESLRRDIEQTLRVPLVAVRN